MTPIQACILTILIETPVLAVWGARRWNELVVVVSANAVTNLLLNLFLWLCPFWASMPAILLPEAVVIAAEYGIFRLAFGVRRGLPAVTVAANVLSFCLGLLIQSLPRT